LLDRVLALSDGHPEALRLLAQLDRAARTRVFLRAGVGSAVLGGMAALWVAFAPPPDAGPARANAKQTPTHQLPKESARSAPKPTPPAPASPTPSTTLVEPPAQAPEVRRPSARPRPVTPTPSAGPRTVIFDPDPANVSISVDGAPPRHFGPSFRMAELTPGAHNFRFIGAHGCCEDSVVDMEIPAGPGETVVSAKLAFRPARVYVVSDVPADVDIGEGAATGRTRNLINVPVERSYIERRRISVTAPGHEAYTGSVQLRAGQVTQLEVALEPQ
jgi:hypothetical protein